MGSAAYTVTENQNTGVVRQVVIGVRPKTGSSLGGTTSDFPGQVYPEFTLNFPIGNASQQFTVTTVPNAAVDGNREYEFFEKSRSPAGGTFDFQRTGFTIVDDDASGGGGAGSTPTAPTDSADLAASSTRDFNTTKTTHRITLPARSAGLSAEIYVAYDGVGDFVDIVIDATSILIKKIDDFNNTGTPVSVTVDTKQTIVIDKLTDSVEVRAGGTLVATMTGVTFPGTKTRVYTNVAIPGYVSTATNV